MPPTLEAAEEIAIPESKVIATAYVQTGSPGMIAFEPALQTHPAHIQRTIMVAMDGSEYAQRALEWSASNLMDSTKDLVVIVNVRENAASSLGIFGSDIQYEDFVIKADEENRVASRMLLHKAIAVAHSYDTDLYCRGVSVQGDAREEILRQAKEVHADVLVVGSHGRGRILRTLLGSVSDYLVNHSACHVFVIKENV